MARGLSMLLLTGLYSVPFVLAQEDATYTGSFYLALIAFALLIVIVAAFLYFFFRRPRNKWDAQSAPKKEEPVPAKRSLQRRPPARRPPRRVTSRPLGSRPRR